MAARWRTEAALRNQASLLDLAHEAIVVRNINNDAITYWNSGAERIYGWNRSEAVGQIAQQLMRSVYPSPLANLKTELIREGRWEGELIQTRRDGRHIVVASRWALQRDDEGAPIALLQINTDITEHKQAAEELRKSEERWRSVFENSAVGVALTDLDGRFLATNPAYQKMLGYSEHELRTLSFLEITHEDDQVANRKSFGELVSGKGPYFEIEKRYQRKDSNWIWVHDHVSLIPDGEGPRVAIAIVQDVTARRRVEAERKQLASLVEKSSDCIGIADLELRVVFLNEAGRLLIGLDGMEDVRATKITDYVFPEDQLFIVNELLPALLKKGSWASEFRLRHFKTGQVVWVLLDAFRIDDAETGKPTSVATISRDITERRRAEEERKRLAAIVQKSSDFIGIADLESRVVFLNEAGQRLVGLNGMNEVSATKITDYFFPEDREFIRTQVLPKLFAKGFWTGESRFRHFKTGQPIWVVFDTVRIDDPKTGEPMNLATVSRDITDRKRAAEALQEMRTQLAHMERATTMGELAASIAHELNQPLTGVVMNGNACLRWLAGEPPNLEEARAAAMRIVRDGNRADEVIRKIRSLLKRAPSQMERLEPKELIIDTLALMQSQADRQGVLLRGDVSSDVPVIKGDRVQLQQVMLNLIINGLEAVKTITDRTREVVVSADRSGIEEVVVAVRDSGIGIDPQHLHELFKPFFSTKPDGMGMGLAISRSIIEMHGGRLWATSNDGSGATFQFSLPAATRD